MLRADRLLAFGLPFLAALALFAVTLGFDLTFDDAHHMAAPGVTETRTWSQVWNQPTLFYRPVVVSTFWTEGTLDLPLWARHGVNVLLHGAVTLLIVRLALSLGFGAWWAGAAGMLFAVHPAHVEAVAGLVGRADVLAALWLLLALWLHDRVITGTASGGRRIPKGAATTLVFLGALALAFLAAGSKESAWLLPVFALALHGIRRKALRTAWPLWAGYALGIGALLVLRRAALGGFLRPPGRVILPYDNPLASLDGLDRFLGGLRVVGLNAYHLAFPVELAPDYSGGHFDLSGGLADWRLWAGVVLLAGSVIGVAWGARHADGARGRSLFLAGVILIGSAFVVMNLAFDLETVLGDRLLYWPSVAWVLIVVSGASALWGAGPGSWRRARAVAVIGVLLALGAGYAVRSAAYLPWWKNDYTLFSRAVTTVPEVPRVWYNLGLSQRKAGEVEAALASFRRARTLAGDLQEAWAEEAAILMASGRWDAARKPLQEALRLAPTDPVVLTNRAVLLLHEGKTDAAVADLQRVLDTDPRNADALYNLGVAENQRGRYEAAAEAWYRYLEERPGDTGILVNLAWLLAKELGRAGEAEDLARRAAAAEPDNAFAYDALAETLSRQGRKAEAVEAAQEALRLYAASGREDAVRYRDASPDYFRNRLRTMREAAKP